MIINYAEKIGLDKSLINHLKVIVQNYEERIKKLSKNLLNGIDCLAKENDLMRLAVVLNCLNSTNEIYKAHGISDDIFWNTASDIKIWCESNQNKGLRNYHWITNHLKGELFRLGRLQFQIYTCCNNAIDYSKLPFDCGEKVIYIHIPQGEKLIYDDCVKSINDAKTFFKTYFPDYQFKYFFCESWLLYEGNANFMKQDSNILKFASLFNIAYSVKEQSQAIKRIFGEKRENADDYPEKTSLQKAAKEYIQNNNTLGLGIGTIKA